MTWAPLQVVVNSYARPGSMAALSLQRRFAMTNDKADGSLASATSGIPIDAPAPPRPAFYVPPEERELGDASLDFLHESSPLKQRHRAADAAAKSSGQPLGTPGPGQGLFPDLKFREKPAKQFMDADAARVQSTSVHAGKSLFSSRHSVDPGEYYGAPVNFSADAKGGEHISRLNVFDSPSLRTRIEGPADEAPRDGDGRHDTLFTPKYEFSDPPASEEVSGEGAPQPKAPPKPLAKQLELDLKKLEYFYGSPQYEEMLQEFREKYGSDQTASEAAREQPFSASEVAQGLQGQPIDFARASPKLQSVIASGPRAYDPVIVMQQYGMLRYQGYAFPPSTVLGKLKSAEDVKALQDAHRGNRAVRAVRRTFYSLIGRPDTRESHLATSESKEDTHIAHRVLGLDAVQRRQMRFMLTDFDYSDKQATFHVMMSYPYTDWIHAFYMVLIGWALYELQRRCGAYEFYDEYLGLDLRQVPSAKKPVLVAITVFVMIGVLFQPLLIASVATTRAYRIFMRRPIGPP